jgi:hypothetical protein
VNTCDPLIGQVVEGTLMEEHEAIITRWLNQLHKDILQAERVPFKLSSNIKSISVESRSLATYGTYHSHDQRMLP